jgi:glycosyltransferase involved in cell wall biosynthesis
MPVYNGARLLAMAIRSILSQTYPNWELILLDDGSSDDTVKIARSFRDPRIRVIADGGHKALSERLNQAIDLSNGKYFARMDHDDVSYPERFQREVDFLEQHPEIDLVGAAILIFSGEGVPRGGITLSTTHAEICRRPWGGFKLPHPTWMGRTEWFRRHKYRPKMTSEDQDLLYRTFQESQFACLPEILLGYREERITVIKGWRYRKDVAGSLIRHVRAGKLSPLYLAGVPEQALKGLIDLFAVTTGLKYRILRHRARPVEPATLKRWGSVWAGVQSAPDA